MIQEGFSLNIYQICYIILVLSGFGVVYGRWLYKRHQRIQAKKQHWKDRKTKR